MCDLGFLPQVSGLLAQVRPDGQRMLFSATLDGDVGQLVRDHLHDPVVHSVDPAGAAVAGMEHHLLVVHGPDRYAVTTEIAARDGRVLLFLETKHAVDRLTRHLRASGVRAGALHSGKSQPQRTRTLAQFKEGGITVLVATDVAARGLHVDDLDLVVNVDPPADAKDYVHRAGRTARAGASGRVVTLVASGGRKETLRMLAEAGIKATVTPVRSGEAELTRITGAKALPASSTAGPPRPAPRTSTSPSAASAPARAPRAAAAPAAGPARPARHASSPRRAGPPRCAAAAERHRAAKFTAPTVPAVTS